MVQKIVIIGPESTGKSTLSKQLAAHYETSYVPEFARRYLENKKDKYGFDDLYAIAVGQLALEDELAAEVESNMPTLAKLIVDTDLSVIKVWSEFVFKKCDNRILTQIARRKYDLYLLCATDLPWVKDELREYPDLHTREIIYQYYKDFLVNQRTPWAEITGGYEERLAKAIEAIDKL